MRIWPADSGLAKARSGSGFGSIPKPWVEIIGVVGDVHQTALDVDPAPEIYRPVAQDTQMWLAPRALVIRTRGEPLSFATVARQQFQTVDGNVPIYGLASMDALLEKSFASRRLEVLLVGAFGCLALVLACIGIYGVVAYVVAQRGQEIGIRMALGATCADVTVMMLRKGLSPVLMGLLIGLAAALALSRFLSTQLYGVKATDAFTFGAVALLMVVVAAGAAYFPARRAARIDPILALRHD